MKNILSILILLLTFNSYAQEASQYVITNEDEKIVLYNDVKFSESSVFSYDKEGEKVSFTQKKIKYLVVGNRIWKVLNVKGSINRLHEIIAFNEKYVFTHYNHYSTYYLWDRNYKNIKSVMLKKDEIMAMVKENFKDCKQLLDAMNQNINTYGIKKKAYNSLTKGVSYYNCNNSPDLFTNKKAVKKEVSDPTTKQSNGLNLEENYIITVEGEKIEATAIDPNFVEKPAVVYWLKGKPAMKIIKKNKIKLMVYKGRLFLPLSVGAKKPEFVEIIAYNDKYILAGKWHIKKGEYDVLNGRTGDSPAVEKCYVFDRDYNMIKGDIAMENISGILTEYFKDCSGLPEKIKQNLKFKKNLSEGFTYFGCNGSKPLMDKWE